MPECTTGAGTGGVGVGAELVFAFASATCRAPRVGSSSGLQVCAAVVASGMRERRAKGMADVGVPYDTRGCSIAFKVGIDVVAAGVPHVLEELFP